MNIRKYVIFPETRVIGQHFWSILTMTGMKQIENKQLIKLMLWNFFTAIAYLTRNGFKAVRV